MYQTLLSSTVLGTKDAHTLKAGALNDMQDEDEGGVVMAQSLPLKHKALNFGSPACNITRYQATTAASSPNHYGQNDVDMMGI